MRTILASSSPRRRELLSKIVNDFEIITSPVDERQIEEKIEKEHFGLAMQTVACEMVKELSFAKADAVRSMLGDPEDTIIIGADTAVAVSDEIMGKPKDRDDAVRMLRKLSLEPQYVLTGVTVMINGRAETVCETSLVVFNHLDDVQEAKIQAYCDTPEPYDKAGAYGIQVIGDEMVDHVEGDIDNIIGFPTARVRKMLQNIIKNYK